MKVNYAEIAIALERGEIDDATARRALADIVRERGKSGRGLAGRVDGVLEPLQTQDPTPKT